MTGRGQLQRTRQARFRACDVECERLLTGQRQVPARGCLQPLYIPVPSGGTTELERMHVVMGEHVGHVFGPSRGLPLDPRGSQLMPRRAVGARNLSVADIPDEGVLESVLGFPFHRGRACGEDELSTGQVVQGHLDLGIVPHAHLEDRAGPEDLADHRCVLQHGLSLDGEQVEAGGDQPLHALGKRDVADLIGRQAPIREQANELLGIQRVAGRRLEQRALRIGGQRLALEQSGDEP